MITLPPISIPSGSLTSSPTSRPGARSDGRSTRALRQRPLESLQHPDHAQSRLCPGARPSPVADAVEEVAALDPQRLFVRHGRREYGARAREVLAVRGVVLVEALVVDGELALELHVVERRHPLRADDREATLLVRIEPGQMHVRGEPRGKAEVAEDHVLDAVVHIALAHRAALVRLLGGEPQDHGHVVCAERPEGVLVAAQLTQVEPVRVDIAHFAELAGLDQLVHLLDAGVVLEKMPDHEHPVAGARGLDDLLRLLDRASERLLDKAVLARLEHLARQLGVRGHRGGERDRIERLVAEHLVEGAGRTSSRKRPREPIQGLGRLVAEPGELAFRQAVEVPCEVGTPVAEAHDPDSGHRRTRFGASIPRVAPRKSTTSADSRTMRSTSRSGWAVTITVQSASSGHSERSASSGSSNTK